MSTPNENEITALAVAGNGSAGLLTPPSTSKEGGLDRTIQFPPTVEQFGAFQLAFHFNEELFGEQLPTCILNLSRKRGAGGFFAAERWKKEGAVVHEISLNPDNLERPMEEVMATLVHEMVHLWQEEFGTPGRRNYHNVEWADRMEEVGLVPSQTGEPGGKRIGDSMTHYVDREGSFKKAFDTIPEHALMPWRTALRRRKSGGSTGMRGRAADGQRAKPNTPARSVRPMSGASLDFSFDAVVERRSDAFRR
jgi:predicted SprT family Zn-dependent metalloprotease